MVSGSVVTKGFTISGYPTVLVSYISESYKMIILGNHIYIFRLS
jgi:hypothetical protein